MTLLDTAAMWIGYTSMTFTIAVVLILSVEVGTGKPAWMFTVFGFGPVAINAHRWPDLAANLDRCGYRMMRVGKYKVGFSSPKWAKAICPGEWR